MRLFTDALAQHVAVLSKRVWEAGADLPDHITFQLELVLEELLQWKGCQFTVELEKTHMWTDASDQGWGATMHNHVATYGWFSTSEGHIDLKEFKAGVPAIKAYLLRDTELHLHVHNMVFFYYLKVKQSHARIMGLLPSNERVHHCTLCAQRAQPSRRVEPSTSGIDGSITGSGQHGNDLEDIFVDRYGNRLDNECGEHAMSKVYFRVPFTGRVRGGHFCSTSAQNIAGFLQLSVAYDPHSSSFCGRGDEIRGSSRGSIPSADTMVAQVPVFGATHDHNLSSSLSSARRSNGQGMSAYDLRVALQDYLRLGGTSPEEIETHMKALGEQTFKRYNRAWLKCLALASSKRSFTSIRGLDNIPICSLAYWLIQSSEKESFAEARCAYAALLLFSGAQALRYEPILKGIKKRRNYSVPRYVVYYDVPKLLQQLPYLEARTESQVRLRLILVLRFFALFPGMDLERTKRTGIIKQGKV